MSSPSGRSESPLGLAALAAVGLGACCGVPLLLAAGVTVTVAGLGIGSWVVIVVGLGVAVSVAVWNRRRYQDRECVPKESVDAR